MSFYDGNKLLSIQDINGEKPEILICTSNRSAGKTVFWSRYLMQRFLKYEEKFILMYRFTWELDTVAEQFFDGIRELFYNDYHMESVREHRAPYTKLYLFQLDDEGNKTDIVNCGYAVALNAADKTKKYSHYLSDAKRILFDEFQPESGEYLPRETDKFFSLHVSIARGGGQQSRFVQTILVGNPVTILNPYYMEFGICERLDDKTIFLRGDGWVMEQGYNSDACNALSQSAFNRAFKNNAQFAYGTQGLYLSNDRSMMGKPSGSAACIASIEYNKKRYGLWVDGTMIYIRSISTDNVPKIAATENDHSTDTVLLDSAPVLRAKLRRAFNLGLIRFEKPDCKPVFFNMMKSFNI